MPRVLGHRGFERRNADRDGLIVLSGTPQYITADLPAGSPSATSLGNTALEARAPWYDNAGGVYEPSTEEFWIGFRYYSEHNGTSNDALRIGVADAGAEYVTISMEDNTNKPTIRVAGVVRATAASAAISLETFERFHVHVEGKGLGDTISVYMDGDLSAAVVEYDLVAGDVTALSALDPNEFYWDLKPSGTERLDDIFALDPAAAGFPGISFFLEAGIKPIPLTGNGPETDWVGDYTDLTELPATADNNITGTGVGDVSSFLKQALGEDNVFALNIGAKVRRTGVLAGENLTVALVSGGDSTGATVAAPGDGDVFVQIEEAPDGSTLTPSKFDSARLSFEAVT